MKVPIVTVNSTTPNNISLSWTSAGSKVENYKITWERDTSGQCPNVDEGNATVSGNKTSYTITQLEEDSSYTINITAINAARITNLPTTGTTLEAGELLLLQHKSVLESCLFVQLHLLLPLLFMPLM